MTRPTPDQQRQMTVDEFTAIFYLLQQLEHRRLANFGPFGAYIIGTQPHYFSLN